MRHQNAFRKLGRTSAHRLALFRNMVTSLILKDRIETTLPKAKELRRVADRMITLGKAGSLAARRKAAAFVRSPVAVQRLFSQLADRFKVRQGGYTRIIRLGDRHGDSAPMAIIEYLTAEIGSSTAAKGKGKRKPAAKSAKMTAPKAPRTPKAAKN